MPVRRPARPARLPRLVVVGIGRLGGSLVRSYQQAGGPVHVVTRSSRAKRTARALHAPEADDRALKDAELCILSVPDAEIEVAALTLAPCLGSRTALIHCAGALTLKALGPASALGNRPRGSFHPLCALSSPKTRLDGITVALSGSTTQVRRRLDALAKALHLQPLEVPERWRARYHAGAVLAAGSAVALLSAAVEAFGGVGIAPERALSALLPLMRSALDGVERRGLPRALTGPIARGDQQTVRRHLESLPRELVPLYKVLADRTLKLASSRLTRVQARGLQDLLNSTQEEP